ncbi:MAG: hypothetical protein KDA27_22580 [Candidatus Eisenbacteria bacterium]|uniref:Secreted protein n=1 Tax=Eiseniibacteriota bacterium TaxID=2212470 RepID=A0A956SFE2_UNCEI|nr:hypothetical protein [Candidatus Eisenbacteria bacterium]
MTRRILFASVALLAAVSTVAGASEVAHETGMGVGTLIGGSEGTCGDFLLNSDGTYENGYTWSYGGVVAPYYGAFVECYEGPVRVCSVVADLTSLPQGDPYPVDVYVFDDNGGVPGTVIASSLGNDTGGIAVWPDISRHTFSLETECIEGKFYVGVWWDASSGADRNFIAADVDGFGGGCPLTNIAPGIGYPTGWQNVSVAWGPTAALGIGTEANPCPTPTTVTTWGKIKSLF